MYEQKSLEYKTINYESIVLTFTLICENKYTPLCSGGRWCSLGIPVSCPNKTDRHDIT